MNPLDDLRNILDPGERMDTTTLYVVAAEAYLDLRNAVIDFIEASNTGRDHEWVAANKTLRKAVGR